MLSRLVLTHNNNDLHWHAGTLLSPSVTHSPSSNPLTILSQKTSLPLKEHNLQTLCRFSGLSFYSPNLTLSSSLLCLNVLPFWQFRFPESWESRAGARKLKNISHFSCLNCDAKPGTRNGSIITTFKDASTTVIVFWGVELASKLSLFVAGTLYSCIIYRESTGHLDQ